MPDVTVRGMSSTLHQALKSAADRNHRSLNGEILTRLEASFEPSTVHVDTLMARVNARKVRTGALRLDPAALRRLKEDGRR
jgi:hypothetical protein